MVFKENRMILINLAVFAALIALLAVIYRRTQKLGATVFVGLILGLASGAILQNFYEKPVIDSTLDWVNLIGVLS